LEKIISRVPRGFTRFYVLFLLKGKSMTGKEIMETAEKRSEGNWNPSPGLIYPLLGRLVKGGLIEEVDNGRFTITPKGDKTLQRYSVAHAQFEKQLKLVRQLGISILRAGRFFTEESLDMITNVTNVVQDAVAKSSKDLQRSFNAKYKQFLISELKKLEGNQANES
jgi:DNA-binding PadR family transcriptional regulator